MRKVFVLLAILSVGIIAGCSGNTVDDKEAKGFGKPSAEDAKKEAEGTRDDR